jgi:hypothetical protein
MSMRFISLLLAGTLHAAARADTIYLCKSSFDLDSLFWSSAVCIPSQASVVETLTVSTNANWDETVFAAETMWPKKQGQAPAP